MVKAVVEFWNVVVTRVDVLLGEIMTVLAVYHVADGNTHEERTALFDILVTDTPAIVRANAGSAIIADAATAGYTLTATDIRFQDGSRGV